MDATKKNMPAVPKKELKLKKYLSMDNPSFEPDEELPTNFAPMDMGSTAMLEIGDIELQERNGINREESEDYEPYENREVKRPTSNWDTFFHLMKGSLGTGILAMPNAFAHSGYVLGVLGTIIVGIICTYCIHKLVRAEYVLCKRRRVPSLTYTEVVVESLKEGPQWCKKIAPCSGYIVNAFLLTYQLGTCCVYVVFISENLKSFIDAFLTEKIDLKIYMASILLPLILINWIKDLKYLAPLSQIANIITLMSFGIIMYYLFREAPSFEGKVSIGNINDIPLFFGTVLFALEAIGVILPLENEMESPSAFVGKWGILNKAMAIIIVLYVGMGFFGYLKYGKDSLGSITLNLPGEDEIPAKIVQVLLAISIFITHALACYVAIDIIWTKSLAKKFADCKNIDLYEYAIRTAIVFLTFALAISVPALDLFISLFGALCLSALGLAFPAMVDLSTNWYHLQGWPRTKLTIINCLLILFGIFGLVIGTYTSLAGIAKEFF